MLKNIVFDYGNVLIQWRPDPIYNSYFKDESKTTLFMETLDVFGFHNRVDGGERVDAVMDEFVRLYPDYKEPIQFYKTRWSEMIPAEVPGMRSLLAELLQSPRFEVFGLTNWSMENFPIGREKFEILRMIDRVVVSGEECLIKPDERIFRLLLDRYGLKAEECLFVDDRAANVEAARKLGMQGHVFVSAEELRRCIMDL